MDYAFLRWIPAAQRRGTRCVTRDPARGRCGTTCLWRRPRIRRSHQLAAGRHRTRIHGGVSVCETFGELLGMPPWLAQFYNEMYERLPQTYANEWLMAFLEAIPVGANLDDLKSVLYAGLLFDPEIGVRQVCLADKQATTTIDAMRDRIDECIRRNRHDLLPAWFHDFNDPIDMIIERPLPFSVRMAYCCVQRITIDEAIPATYNAACARVGSLSRRELAEHKSKHGWLGIVPAWSILGAIVPWAGWARTTDHETQHQKVADFLVQKVAMLSGEPTPGAPPHLITRTRRRITPTGQAVVPASLPLASVPPFRTVWTRHVVAKVLAVVLGLLGGVMLAVAATGLLDVIEWVPGYRSPGPMVHQTS